MFLLVFLTDFAIGFSAIRWVAPLTVSNRDASYKQEMTGTAGASATIRHRDSREASGNRSENQSSERVAAFAGEPYGLPVAGSRMSIGAGEWEFLKSNMFSSEPATASVDC